LDGEPAVVLAYPKTVLIDEDGRVTSECEDGLHLQATSPSERFQQLFERLRYANAQFGLLRADVIRRTRLLGSYLAADIVFLAELSLYGTFWEVPEFLFYRRFHPAASSSMDPVQRRVFWDPTKGRRIQLVEWRHLLELARAIGRAPLGAREKMRVGRFLARRAIWNRRNLARELVVAMRELAPRRVRS
jgi:hypothetical protein